MAIFSYTALILCITNYHIHALNIIEVLYRGKGESGILSLCVGHFFLVCCILSGNYFGWTF